MNDSRPLSIPVILGTPRQGRLSEHVARVMLEQLCNREGVQTALVDVRTLQLPSTDAGEGIKDPHFSETVLRADGLIVVAPEYNHGYPGILKHVLDTNLKEYIHKPVGLCGVSAGGFGGNAFLPVLFLLATVLAGRSVLPLAQDTDIYLAGLGILLTAVYITGLIFRHRRPGADSRRDMSGAAGNRGAQSIA